MQTFREGPLFMPVLVFSRGLSPPVCGAEGALVLRQMDVRVAIAAGFRLGLLPGFLGRFARAAAGFLRVLRVFGILGLLRVGGLAWGLGFGGARIVLVGCGCGLDHLVEVVVEHVPTGHGAHGYDEAEVGAQGLLEACTGGRDRTSVV